MEFAEPAYASKQFHIEPLRINTRLTSAERAERVKELLHATGLAPEMASNCPHESAGDSVNGSPLLER